MPAEGLLAHRRAAQNLILLERGADDLHADPQVRRLGAAGTIITGTPGRFQGWVSRQHTASTLSVLPPMATECWPTRQAVNDVVGPPKEPPEKVVMDIRRATRKRHSPEATVRIVLLLRGAGRLPAHLAWSRTADGSRLTVAWKFYSVMRAGDVIDPLVPAQSPQA